MRLVACDQGSVECGLAFFDDGTLIDLRAFSGGRGDHQRRMARICTGIRALAAASPDWIPHVIAIEDIVMHSRWRAAAPRGVPRELLPDLSMARRGGPSPRTFQIMAETRVYLRIAFLDAWPSASIRDIHPSRVRGVIGGGRSRDAAKRQNVLALRQIAGWTRPATQDMADAYVIGLAALDDIRVAAWNDLAR